MKGIGILTRRGMAILTALLLTLLPLAGLAAALPPQDLMITVQWEGWQGTQISDPALAISYDGFANRYWLTLPPDAPLDGLTLQIQDMTGNYAFFEPGSDTVLQFVKDAGDNLFFNEPIQIMAFNANGDMTGLYFLYLSYQEMPADPFAPIPTQEPLPTEEPIPTEAPAQPATVVIHYVDENWAPIADDTYQTVNPGYNTVYPDAPINSGDYTLYGATGVDVVVDANGANPAEITFTYMRVARPATVTIHYVDENYLQIAPDTYQTLNPGYSTVYPDATFSPEEYEMAGAASCDVYVDANGANPAEVTFIYRHPVMPATVILHYVDENGAAIADDTAQTVNPGNNTVYPAVYINPDDYQMVGQGFYDVYVDANGANPPEVTFSYQRTAHPTSVVLHYVDESYVPIADDTYQTVNPGDNTVYPDGAVNGDDWALISESAVSVLVTADGAAPSEITFVYRRIVKPATVTVHYVDETYAAIAEDTYATVNEGDNAVYPEAAINGEDWVLISESPVSVLVTADGAAPSEITFVYRRIVKPATVTVHYVDETYAAIAEDTYATVNEGDNAVYPEAAINGEDWVLISESPVNVAVDVHGAAPSEITFVYRRIVKPAIVTVHYVDETYAQIAYDTYPTVYEGDNTIAPDGGIDSADWELIGADTYNVVLDVNGVNPQEVTFIYRRIVKPATVTIHYVDEMGAAIATDTYQTVTDAHAPTAVYPQPENLPENFVPAEDAPEFQTVILTADGADPAEITFVYRYVAPATEIPTEAPTEVPTEAPTETPTEAPTAVPTEIPTEVPTEIPTEEPTQAPTDIPVPVPVSVPVTVRYMSQEGLDVATADVVECMPGDTAIQAQPKDLMENYVLDGVDTVHVYVDDNGANPAEVVFVYRYDAPAPKVALVNVRYIRPNGEAFYAETVTCMQGQENVIALDWSRVDHAWGYELASPETVIVTVNGSGEATPGEVTFQFKNEVNAYVTIRFQDASDGRDVASPRQELCYVGSNIVEARPIDLEENYRLLGDSSQTVILNADGTLSQEEIIFRYEYIATPAPVTPAPTQIPIDEPMDTYGYPTGTSINFRSSPTTAENNIIGTVNSNQLAHIIGKVTTTQNKVWYAVEINGQQGYLSETVVRLLSEAEIAALFGYTQLPTQPPTPVPTDVPVGAAIDRWAITNASVNFRRSPQVADNKIDSLSKNTRLWVYDSQNVGGDIWYRVCVKGTDGYLMSRYVDLFSQAESDAIQATIASPVPTQAPQMTQAPTDAPTDVPTQAPTDAPTQAPDAAPTSAPTATPVPYRGYALTQGQVPLRTGASLTDDTIMQVLMADSLVIVTDEVYVDGTAWSKVQDVRTSSFGYMPSSSLQPISNEAARPYLDQINATEPPVTATPVPDQYDGYAMTKIDNVPMRGFPDTNGEILTYIPYGTVAIVRGQYYTSQAAWHLVQYNGLWGYVRQDLLRMMDAQESLAYDQSLAGGTPTPSPAPTPEPITQDSPSSYGHIISNSGKVNLRAEPSTQASRVRLLDNYAFALVMGTVSNSEGTWYHISQAGTEGYVMSNYFKVLTLGELSSFLQSNEYLDANGGNANGNANEIQPVEDYNAIVWQNPALAVSYEPFNPYATPTPDPELLVTETPAPTATALVTEEPTVLPTVEPEALQGDETPKSGNGWILPAALLGVAAVGGGGIGYAYYLHRKNEKRRQAARNQQARQSSAGGQPVMRQAQNNPTQVNRPAYPAQSTAPFMPPQGGSPRPTQNFKPLQTTAPAAGETKPFKPFQDFDKADGTAGGTQNFRPFQNMNSAASRPATTQQPFQDWGSGYQAPAATGQEQGTSGGQPAPTGTQTAGRQRQRRSDRYKNMTPDQNQDFPEGDF